MAPHQGVENHHGAAASTSPKQSPLSLSVNKNGHNVAKPASGAGSGASPYRRDPQPAMHAPTIRVIHIFAPKVIKTDVANFRSTVQKLTGRSKRSQRRAARATQAVDESNLAAAAAAANSHPDALIHPSGGVALGGSSFPALWDQESSQKEVLQRLVGDACGTDLVRCDSVDSATYSLDSGNFSGDSNGSNHDGELPSPTDSFSFYPQRETPYLLSEIPAPFFGADMHSCFNLPSPTLSSSHHLSSHCPLPILDHHNHNLSPLPSPGMLDHNMSMLGFDVELGAPLPLDAPFPSLGGTPSGGSLYDLMPRQHCRLSVQQPYQGSNNCFESI